jgi:HSP20 family protein
VINRAPQTENGLALLENRFAPMMPFRDLFGFDPFRDVFSTWNADYGVTRTDRGYEVEVPVPGYKPDEIDVTYQNNRLTISGKNERRSFTRLLTLPEDVNEEAIEAHVEDGILRLTLPRFPEAQPKKIKVISSG